MRTTQQLKLKVVGQQTMYCSGCEGSVKFALARLPGVRTVEADHRTQLIVVDVAPEAADLEAIRAELDWIGYQVEEAA